MSIWGGWYRVNLRGHKNVELAWVGRGAVGQLGVGTEVDLGVGEVVTSLLGVGGILACPLYIGAVWVVVLSEVGTGIALAWVPPGPQTPYPRSGDALALALRCACGLGTHCRRSLSSSVDGVTVSDL
jgi:hypothetical protein